MEQKIVVAYEDVLDVFEDEDGKLSNLIHNIAEEGKASEQLKVIEEIHHQIRAAEWGKDIDLTWAVFEYGFAFAKVAFAMGYTLGKIFDVADPEVIQTVEQIKGLIGKSGIFPYLPIEPKKSLNSCQGNSAPVL